MRGRIELHGGKHSHIGHFDWALELRNGSLYIETCLLSIILCSVTGAQDSLPSKISLRNILNKTELTNLHPYMHDDGHTFIGSFYFFFLF